MVAPSGKDRRSGSHRSRQDAVDSPLWPNQGSAPDPDATKRHAAIAEVLTTIPPDAWDRLEGLANKFSWFIPPSSEDASVRPFSVTEIGDEKDEMSVRYAAALYVSPLLESRSFSFSVACIAHELAHIALGHHLFVVGEKYEKQELEAWNLVREWGFHK